AYECEDVGSLYTSILAVRGTPRTLVRSGRSFLHFSFADDSADSEEGATAGRCPHRNVDRVAAAEHAAAEVAIHRFDDRHLRVENSPAGIVSALPAIGSALGVGVIVSADSAGSVSRRNSRRVGP